MMPAPAVPAKPIAPIPMKPPKLRPVAKYAANTWRNLND